MSCGGACRAEMRLNREASGGWTVEILERIQDAVLRVASRTGSKTLSSPCNSWPCERNFQASTSAISAQHAETEFGFVQIDGFSDFIRAYERRQAQLIAWR